MLRLLLIVTVVAVPAFASDATLLTSPFVPILEGAGGNQVQWVGGSPSFVFNALLSNSATFPSNIVAGSDPVTAIQNAAATWAAASAVNPTVSGFSSQAISLNNNTNLITFAHNASNASVTSGTIAVTVYHYNGLFNFTNADLVFNQTMTFSTLGTPNTFDIEAVAAHEFGHAFGVQHSPMTGATMYAAIAAEQNYHATLSEDDCAAINLIYPKPNQALVTGNISGTITQNGANVYGAHVAARSYVDGRTVAGTITHPDGTYTITGLPPGPYEVYAEPLDGPAFDGQIVTSYWTVGKNTSFPTTFFGGNTIPTLVRVQATQTTTNVDINAPAGAPVNNLNLIALSPGPAGGFSLAQSTCVPVTPGSFQYIAIGGFPVNTTPDNAFSMSGSGVTFGPASTGSGIFIGIPETWKVFPLTVAASAPPGLRDIEMVTGGERIVYSGAVDVVPASPPVARVQPYGFGCSSAALPLTLAATGGAPTVPNNGFGLIAVGTVPGNSVFFIFCEWPDLFDLGGCNLWVDATRPVLPLTTFFQTATGLTTTQPVPIPNIPTLAGLEVYAQAFAQDPAATLGYLGSNGLRISLE